MTGHPDILDQPEPMGKSLLGSVILHLSVVAVFLTAPLAGHRTPELWGDIHGGGIGSVAVNAVSQIPIPARSGPTNPVANPTESVVPEPPPKPKPQPKAKPPVQEPDPDAIALQSRNALKKRAEAASQPNKWRQQQKELPNQVYSTVGQAAVSPLFGMQGGGGVGIGNNSPFGNLYGDYANLLRETVARHWNTGDIDPRIRTLPPVSVTFTIMRNGSVPANSVKISQTSGNLQLDLSAQRAILDAQPFPALPAQFPRNQADIEFVFQLRR